jgi:hypothetical protein
MPKQNEGKKKQMTIESFTNEVKDLDVEYEDDKNGYRTFKSGKRVLCYTKNTKYGFSIAYRSDLAKSGWKSNRVTNKKDFEAEVEKFKKMVEQSELITNSLKPIFRCSYEECKHIAESKEQMIQHIVNSH